jgi:hypothetical protein
VPSFPVFMDNFLLCQKKCAIECIYVVSEHSEFRFRSLIRIATREEGQAANETKGI